MKNLFMLLATALAPALSLAWGPAAHWAIAEIAQRHLSAQTRSVIERDLLGPDVSLASVASWADGDVRRTRPETRGWHFVDLRLAQTTYDDARDCVYRPRTGPPLRNNCIVAAIESQAEILKSPTAPRADREEALRFIVHLVGDVHQPMHTVDEGVGGNDIRVYFPCNEQDDRCPAHSASNLHAVWDSGLLRAPYFRSWGEIVDELDARYIRTGRANGLLKGCQGAPRPVVCWALETHDVARKPGYVVADNSVLGDRYVQLVAQDRDRQLVRAGLRLAGLLDAVLSKQ
ncbi:MAG: S1/P1 nuclease [Gammaproteobacteria bacterium]|nr:S1/P1 nuclease [Gammaproteobacteria bacterium]MBU1441191.1 S1/P1 nuclease [Gammaproteobacteria bacterium]MBU2407649.1 S1/P1 nuclease [Gammaproteobacteria bacterium]